MPIKPGSSPIIFNNTTSPVASGTIYVDSVDYTEVFQNFDRLENSNPRLRAAPTLTGALPMIQQAFGNQPIQFLTVCTGDRARPLGPDDANIAAIKQRFNIIRYTIKGAVNATTPVNNLFSIFQTHLGLLDQFDLYLQVLQMEISIGYLEDNLQPYNFTYLTTTGLSLTSNIFGGTISNLLLTEFTPGVAYEAPIPGSPGSSQVLVDFTATFENRTVSSRHL